ncbi:MAG: RnfABCDGE type electron transport complex subunit D [Phycisphaerales bacterium]|nr:RnfABCDGE type electron transport complex subunit D [Phycisphaerales bacterium]
MTKPPREAGSLQNVFSFEHLDLIRHSSFIIHHFPITIVAMTTPPPTAPFLVWPVARREFYLSIAAALLLPLMWAFVIFGWRVLGMFVGSTVCVVIGHLILRRFGERGKLLILPHCLVSAWVLVALSDPQWPIWSVAVAALLIPLILWIGRGRRRIHVAVILALGLQFGLVPLLRDVTPGTGAILARDRLIMGDIRNHYSLPVYLWPRSAEIAGNDALAIPYPSQLSLVTLDRLARDLSHEGRWTPDDTLGSDAQRSAQSLLDGALAKLPDMHHFLMGVSPGRVGTVSLIGLLGSGLFLAYRHILRFRSAIFFLLEFCFFSALIALWPAFFFKVAAPWQIGLAFPGEIVTLLIFAIFNSDVLFAAIIILALPGTEPLTTHGRRFFLLVAAFLAAVLHRSLFPIPAATVAIAVLMPLAARFDQYFARRSWLNRWM